jgi:predicted transcriptional regulator of viral defense system
MPSASDYVNELVAQGKYHFTTEEAVAALGESISRVRAGLRRLKARGELVNRKPIDCGRSRVEFVARKDLDRTPVLDEPLRGRPLDKPWLEKAAANGGLRVASPEATAIELVGYADRCGGLERVADVLSELVDSLDPERLAAVAPLSPIVWTQRLGYLLDITEHRGLANVLVPVVRDLAHDFSPLVRARPRGGARKVPRWKLVVNASV